MNVNVSLNKNNLTVIPFTEDALFSLILSTSVKKFSPTLGGSLIRDFDREPMQNT